MRPEYHLEQRTEPMVANQKRDRAFYLVWNPRGECPKKRHETAEDARLEATRLAKLHPDNEFYVLKTLNMTIYGGYSVTHFRAK